MADQDFSGQYIGICLQNDDPAKRGRIKIYIPHITPTVYEDWVQLQTDKVFRFPGQGNDLTPNILDVLQKVLPWAECASPIMGGGSSGRFNRALIQSTPSDSNNTQTAFTPTPVTPTSLSTDGYGHKPARLHEAFSHSDAFASNKTQLTVYLTTYAAQGDTSPDSDTINHRSSTGAVLKQGVSIAVDPTVIPYGSQVIINGNTYIAQDTGGDVRKKVASNGQLPVIDVFFDDANSPAARAFQAQNPVTTVTILPPDGKYIATQNINQKNPYATTYVPASFSNTAKGLFSIPNVGSHVWCFFHNNDPLFPIYFATALGESDWGGIQKIIPPGESNPPLANSFVSPSYPGSYENLNTTA